MEEECSESVVSTIHDTDGACGSTCISVRKVVTMTGSPKISVHRIVRDQLAFFPYKLCLLQDLKLEDHLARRNL